ncbi:MAG: hypothetical protein H7246_21230 [Phycisphaerae bacterium]|nr:hypothetical protein [Saprospiraceae bacterium]
MALNEWLYTKDRTRKKELEKDILRRIAAGQAADFMVLKILEGPRSPEEFEVPENWRKHLKQKGLARATRKAWIWALPLWVLLCVGVVGWKPEEVGCKGVALTYSGKEWCPETLEELLQVWEMQALGAIDHHDATASKSTADTIVKGILKTGRKYGWRNQSTSDWKREVVWSELPGYIDSISFFQNLAIGYFNRGVSRRDLLLEKDNLSCIYFRSAQQLNVLLPDSAQLWYVREAAMACSFQSNPFGESSDPEYAVYPSFYIGGGLGGRSVIRRSRMDKYLLQKSEIIVIYVCVDSTGIVTSALPRAKGSTTMDSELRAIALKAAISYRFLASSQEKQCGTITFNFWPDRDGDGVLDVEDNCPDDYGVIEYKGCPEQIDPDALMEALNKASSEKFHPPDRNGAVGNVLLIPMEKEADRDGDGVSDAEDKCPDEKGDLKNSGCLSRKEYLQQSKLNGVVTIHNSEFETGKKVYVSNVIVSTHKSTASMSDAAGRWLLVLIDTYMGDPISLNVTKKGYEVVNIEDLKTFAGQKSLVEINMAPIGYIADAKRKYYSIARTGAEKSLIMRLDTMKGEISKLKKQPKIINEEKIKSLEQEIASLNDQRNKIDDYSRELAEKFAKINLDDTSELYQKAFILFEKGDLDGAINLLKSSKLDEESKSLLIKLNLLKRKN